MWGWTGARRGKGELRGVRFIGRTGVEEWFFGCCLGGWGGIGRSGGDVSGLSN